MANSEYWYRGSLVSSPGGVEGTGNLTLDIKYIFTSFLQKFFENQTRYKWSSNIQQTKIIIADKNAIDIGVVERRPSIIVSRGNLGWAYATRAQGSMGHNPKGAPITLGELHQTSEEDSTQTDLVRGSITINCLAKYGLQAEELANLCFFAISGNKNRFYKRGLHSITGLSLGEENILRSNSDIELTAVPVSLQYSLVKDVFSSFRTFDVVLHYIPPEEWGWPEQEWYEGSHFSIGIDGRSITTFEPPTAGADLLVTYVEAITGIQQERQDLVGELNGTNSLFYLPNNDSALGYYKVLTSGIIDILQGGDIYPTPLAVESGLAYSGISQQVILSESDDE